MDRRLTPANDRAALEGMRGRVTAPRFVTGEAGEVRVPLADLRRSPGGPRDRQVQLGEALLVIDRHAGFAFVQMGKDGYCGYLAAAEVGPLPGVTHRVTAVASHLYPEPRVQAEATAALSFGARVRVTEAGPRFCATDHGFIPTPHLRPLDVLFPDPVDVAHLFLSTPYLWGGNSRAGLDCSGLVQAALLACGVPCPGDSDQQMDLGVAADGPLRRGDLLFWQGHVAMAVDATMLIHANGHAMAVALEGAEATCTRIAAQGGGAVLAHRRVTVPA